MTLKASLERTIRAFCEARDGNITIMFGLTFMFLTVLAGGTVDYVRWLDAKAKAANALDSAVLAGGRAMQVSGSASVTEAIAAAQSYYERMKPTDTDGGTAVFDVVENGTVLRGRVSAQVRSVFLSVIGKTHQSIDLTAEAVLAAGGNSETNVEVSMMLDVTGSMSGQKIEDMKTAAKDLIDIVVWSDQSTYTSKVAIAPFAPRVNTGSYTSAVTGKAAQNNGKLLIQCVTERDGTEAFTDAAPGVGTYVRPYKGDTSDSNYSTYGTCSEPSADEQVMPLTNDKDALKSRVDKLTANGTTAGQLGTAWAWYLISPKWKTIWPMASEPASYSDLTTLGASGKPKLQKIVVLMTDGAFNTYGAVQYGDNSSQATTISGNAVSICTNMKAAGIKVYTVGFALGSSELAINTLKSCASREASDPADSPSYFYNTSTGDQLKQAFRDIALKIATLRLRS